MLRNILRWFWPRLFITAPHGHTYGPDVIPANIGRRVKRRVVSSNYTVLGHDEYVVGTAAIIVTLPAASAVPEGWTVTVAIADVSNGTGYIMLVVPTGLDTIVGCAGVVTLGSGSATMVVLVSDGADNWEATTAGSPLPT